MMPRTACVLRPVWLPVLAITLLPASAFSGSLEMITTGRCACCHAWARHLQEVGHEVTVKDFAMGQLMKMKLDAGIQELAPGRIEVAVIDPVASMAAIDNSALLEKAAIVRQKLETVIESL